jgi:hypothetical protein
MKHPLAITVEARELEPVLEAVVRWPWFSGEPTEVIADDEIVRVPSGRRWVDVVLAAKQSGGAKFSPPNGPHLRSTYVGLARGLRVSARAPEVFERAEDVLTLLASLPLEVCSIASAYYEWMEMSLDDRPTRGFANRHEPLGFGCVFRGRGYDRLVSRRWLDFGPWRILRGPDDLTMVQFHDLDADPQTALAQALPGHERIGISETSGFIQGPSLAGKGIKYVVSEKLPEGLYNRETRTLEVVVAGRTISQGEMRDACAYRLHKRNDPKTPIEHVAYVFLTDAEARAHLHEMWLRELQVWTVERGDKRRVDLDYHPTPSPPEWVRELERRSHV